MTTPRKEAIEAAEAIGAKYRTFGYRYGAAEIIQAAIEKATKRLQQSCDFYHSRCQELQRVQSTMRDPERKMVCDILANGTTYEPAAQPQPSGERSEKRNLGRELGYGAASSELPLRLPKDYKPGVDNLGFTVGAASSEPPKEELGEWTVQSVRRLLGWKADVPTCQNIIDAHNAALAAERENGTRLACELCAALAAIEKIDKVINGEEAVLNGKISGNLVTRIRLAIKQAGNLSALEQHDAGVRKPLVDALEKVVELYPHLTNLKDLLASVKEGKPRGRK